jgi:C4-dicarboxylate transporter, DctM subunit
MEGLITLLIMITLIITSIPVAFSMVATSILIYVFIAHIPLGVVVQNMFYNVQSYSYSAVPYFILAGNIMARGKLAPKMLEIAEAFVGFVPSGMAIAMVLACALFGTLTGSDLATLAAIGGIMFPALVARGWPKAFVGGILGPSALLGMLIPPTIPGLIYALVAEVSVMKVFLSGVMPALIIVIFFSIYIYSMGKKIFPDQKWQKPDFLRMARSLKNGMTALGMPLIIFGGVYGGIFTVTEAAAVAAGYALFVELVIHRGIKFTDLPGIAIDTGVTTSVVLFLCSGAMVLAHFLTLEQIPQMWAEQIFSLVRDKWIFMFFINIFLLVTGCLIDVLSAIVILVPIFKQLYLKFRIDEIYFASVFLLNMYIGYLTPPVGINIFVVSGMFGIPFLDCCRAYMPYCFLMLITLALVTIFPPLSTWLPSFFSR